MIGYMNGLALTILVGQLPKLFGFSVDADGLIGEIGAFVRALADGEAVPAAAAIGLGGIAVILVLQRWLPKVPPSWSWCCSRSRAAPSSTWPSAASSLVGVLPEGFPPLTIPTSTWSDLGPLVGGALAIAVVSLADTISTSSAFAARTRPGGARQPGDDRHRYGERRRRPLPGLPGQHQRLAHRGGRAGRGAKRSSPGSTGAALIVLMIVLLPGLFRNLPQPALAAVVITASLSLADIPGTAAAVAAAAVGVHLSLAAFLGVALLGVLPGIAIAVGAVDPQRLPAGVVAVRDRARAGRRTARLPRHPLLPGRQQLPGLVIYRFDAPLFFANARTFRDEVRADRPAGPGAAVDRRGRGADHRRRHHRRRRAVRARPTCSTSAGSSLVFAELKDPVRQKIEVYGLTEQIQPEHFFPTVERPSGPSARRPVRTGRRWRRRPCRPPRPEEPGTTSESAPDGADRSAGELAGRGLRLAGRWSPAHRQRPERGPVRAGRAAAGCRAGSAEPHPQRARPDGAPDRGGQPHGLAVDTHRDRRPRPSHRPRPGASARCSPLVGAVEQGHGLAGTVHAERDDAEQPAVEPGAAAQPGEVASLVGVVADQQRLRRPSTGPPRSAARRAPRRP